MLSTFHSNLFLLELFDFLKVSKKNNAISGGWKRVTLLSLALTGFWAGKQEISTNLDILSSVVDEIVDEGMHRMGLNSGEKIFLMDTGDKRDLSRFVMNRFCQGLMERGIEIYTTNDTISEEGIVVSLILSKASVRYDGIYRHSFWSRGLVKRTMEVCFSLRAVNGQSGKMIWIGDIGRSRDDRVPVSKLDFVEQGGFLLGKPVRPAGRGIHRWIEPVLVVGTVGVITYLFYSARSR